MRNTETDIDDLSRAIANIIADKGELDDAAAYNRIVALAWVRARLRSETRLTGSPVPRYESPC